MDMSSEGAIQESLDRQGVSWPSVDRGLRHIELKVGREIEADCSSTQKRLGMQVLSVLSNQCSRS